MKIKILVAVDLSAATARIVEVTERIAKGMSGEAWILHVAEAEPDLVGFDAGPKVVRDQVAKEFREEHKQVQQYADTLREAGIEATALLIRGPIVDTVLQEAQRLEVDLIIVGSHGFGALYDLLVGSESRGILKKSEIPVLVVPVKDD
jgi:nucleotide-binding universal stress UspA family protein